MIENTNTVFKAWIFNWSVYKRWSRAALKIMTYLAGHHWKEWKEYNFFSFLKYLFWLLFFFNWKKKDTFLSVILYLSKYAISF